MSPLYALRIGSGFKQFPNQSVNLLNVYGHTVASSLKQIHDWTHSTDIQCVAIGISLGLSVGLLFVMLGYVVLDPKYLRRPIYVLSTICVLLVLARGLLNAVFAAGDFDRFATYFLQVQASYRALVFGLLVVNALTLPALYATVLTTLILQVRIVLSTNRRTQKIVTIALSSGAAGLICLSAARKIAYILSITNRMAPPVWLDRIILPTLVILLGSCSSIFLRKLVHLIRQRKRLGLRGFGALHILSIMACQCLIVPSMFALKSED